MVIFELYKENSMLQKYLSGKKIGYFSILIALFGIFLPLLSFDTVSRESQTVIGFIKFFFQSIHLTLFYLEDFYTFRIEMKGGIYMHYNLLNAFFYVLLILGAVLYLKSKSRETRLLRFVYGIIFISKVTFFILSLSFVFSIDDTMNPIRPMMYVLWFLDYVILALYVYVSFSILKYIEKQKTLETIERTYETHTSVNLVEAGRWKRFFHLIIDYFIMIFVFSTAFESLVREEKIQPLLNSLENGLGESGAFIAIVAIFRVLYYAIFESVLGVTAAKLLTESRVTDENGNKPQVGSVIKRTFLRLVPFEAFSFFTASGLHDKWSETYVIKEKKTGASGGWYFLIFPVTIVAALLTAFGIYKYEAMQSEKRAQAEAQQEKEVLDSKLNNLSTNDIINLEPLEYSYSDIYLKTEEIKPDGIVFTILDAKKDYSHVKINGANFSEYNTPNFLEKIYAMEKESAKKITLSRSQLKKAIELNSKYHYSNENTEGSLSIGDGQNYSIKSIESYFMPRLVINGEYSVDKTANVSLANQGWKAELIHVSNGKLNFGQLPIPLYKFEKAEIVTPNAEGFKFQVKIKDTLGRVFSYEVSKKKELETVIKRIE